MFPVCPGKDALECPPLHLYSPNLEMWHWSVSTAALHNAVFQAFEDWCMRVEAGGEGMLGSVPSRIGWACHGDKVSGLCSQEIKLDQRASPDLEPWVSETSNQSTPLRPAQSAMAIITSIAKHSSRECTAHLLHCSLVTPALSPEWSRLSSAWQVSNLYLLLSRRFGTALTTSLDNSVKGVSFTLLAEAEPLYSRERESLSHMVSNQAGSWMYNLAIRPLGC